MKNGFARYYTPPCFWALAPFPRPSSLWLAIRRRWRNLVPCRFLAYTSAPPLGSVKRDDRRRRDEDGDGLERERKLGCCFVCFLRLST